MLTDEDRKRCIAHTLAGTFYVGMVLIKHKIKKVIKERDGMTIFDGELWLRHQPSKTNIHLFLKSDAPNKNNPNRCYGYVDKVMIQYVDDKEYTDSDGYEIRQLVGR